MNDDARFVAGDRIRLRMRPDGKLRHETWRDRWTEVLAEMVSPSPVCSVTSVDAEGGTITLGHLSTSTARLT